MNILHIAAHMGGGIGAAYAGLGTCGQAQTILLLEKPLDKASLAKVQEQGFRILETPDADVTARELANADVVVFNWSHHPAMTKFLVELPHIPIRSLMWCHVSGNYFPYINTDLLKEFDQVVFATQYSLELPQIKALGEDYIRKRFGVVYGMGDIRSFAGINRMPQEEFIIGYVGTMGFCKLHPQFVDYCAAVDIPNVRFAMVGSPSTKDEILFQAEKKGIADKFVFFGQVTNVAEYLERMDVFGYLLNPQHFGATENALLEAMASGVPVVALNQCVERVIVKNGETGLLVNSPEEYGAAVRRLYENTAQAGEFGRRARADMLCRFNIDDNRERFMEYCQKTAAYPKRVIAFRDVFGRTPADWFLSAVCDDKDCFTQNRAGDAGRIFREPTKGSPMHYYSYFPEDEKLEFWARELKIKFEARN